MAKKKTAVKKKEKKNDVAQCKVHKFKMFEGIPPSLLRNGIYPFMYCAD